MLLPFLLLGGKMNNCQLFTFQVRKIAACRKYTENPSFESHGFPCFTFYPYYTI